MRGIVRGIEIAQRELLNRRLSLDPCRPGEFDLPDRPDFLPEQAAQDRLEDGSLWLYRFVVRQAGILHQENPTLRRVGRRRSVGAVSVGAGSDVSRSAHAGVGGD
jgi:hypothetical protein